jgi:hypothetical protein
MRSRDLHITGRKGGICAPWILAIMGLKKEPTLQFVSPPLSELRRRIKLALDGALEKKRANSFPQLFSQSTGQLDVRGP